MREGALPFGIPPLILLELPNPRTSNPRTCNLKPVT
jgi:hypothetical protein